MNPGDDVGFFTAELVAAARSRRPRRTQPIYHYITEAGLTQARFQCSRVGHIDRPGTRSHVTLFPVSYADRFGRPCYQCLKTGGMLT